MVLSQKSREIKGSNENSDFYVAKCPYDDTGIGRI